MESELNYAGNIYLWVMSFRRISKIIHNWKLTTKYFLENVIKLFVTFVPPPHWDDEYTQRTVLRQCLLSGTKQLFLLLSSTVLGQSGKHTQFPTPFGKDKWTNELLWLLLPLPSCLYSPSDFLQKLWLLRNCRAGITKVHQSVKDKAVKTTQTL